MKIELQKQLKAYRKLVLGFSGGADSTALALLLVKQKIPFEAVHFHHHLRQQSADDDAEYCKKFCRDNNIPLQVIDIPVNKHKQGQESIETTARRLRMSFWEKSYSSEGCAVLLAHHKDDIVENFFIRSLRGSSCSGLTGMKKKKIINKVTYLRPLLSLTKQEICEYLLKEKTDWCEDESNRENIYTRNIIRNKIIPTLTEIAPVEGLYRTLDNVASDADFIEQQAEYWLLENSFSQKNFLALHPALKPRALRLFILQQTGKEFIPGHDAVARIDSELEKKHKDTAVIPLGEGIELTLSTMGELYIETPPFTYEWKWSLTDELKLPDGGRLFISEKPTRCSESFDINALSEILTVRSRENGDRMIPFGRKHEVKVKELFTDRKIPQSNRNKLPLIFNGDELIWIPKVKRAEFGRYNPDSKLVTIAYEKL